MSQRKLGTAAAGLAVVLVTFGVVAKADTSGTTGLGFDDPFTQIVKHEIPVEPDGKPTYFPWGRHYTGPNGWEIRLNSEGTSKTVKMVFYLDGVAIGSAIAATGVATSLVAAILGSISSIALRNAAIVATGLAGIAVGDIPFQLALRNRCLGVTVPPGAVAQVFHRAELLARGDVLRVIDEPRFNDIKIWFESCAPGDKPKADSVTPPAPPVAQPADTETARPATPIAPPPPAHQPPAAPQPRQPQAPPPPPALPQTPAYNPAYHDVSMDEACVIWYGAGYTSAYTDANDPNSWICKDPSGAAQGGLRVQEDFCDRHYPGSKAVIVPDQNIPAYWWKCRE